MQYNFEDHYPFLSVDSPERYIRSKLRAWYREQCVEIQSANRTRDARKSLTFHIRRALRLRAEYLELRAKKRAKRRAMIRIIKRRS